MSEIADLKRQLAKSITRGGYQIEVEMWDAAMEQIGSLRAALRQIALRGCSVLAGCPGEARCAACVARQALEGKS